MTTESNLFKTVSLSLISSWLIIFVLIPNGMVIVTSFLQRHEIQLVTAKFSLASYAKLLDPLYWQVFLYSFKLAGLTTLLCLVIGYPFAAGLAHLPLRWRHFWLFLVIVPFWTNSLIRVYAIKVILTTNGLLNKLLLDTFGLISTPLNLLYTEAAVIIGLVYVLLPFMILPLYASLEKLDPHYLEAAQDLGAKPLAIFCRIIIPLTAPGIIMGCLLVFLPALGLFYIPDLLGGAKNLVLGNVIKNQFLDARDWPLGSAASTVLTVVMALLLYAYYKSTQFIRR
jgi:spermidine/putrescine transport system permease protein